MIMKSVCGDGPFWNYRLQINFHLEDQRHGDFWTSSSSYAMLFYDLNVVNPKAYGFDFLKCS